MLREFIIIEQAGRLTNQSVSSRQQFHLSSGILTEINANEVTHKSINISNIIISSSRQHQAASTSVCGILVIGVPEFVIRNEKDSER